MTFLRDLYTHITDFLSELRYRKERFKQRLGLAIWKCIVWMFRPVVRLLAWLLAPVFRFLSPVLTPVGRAFWTHIIWLSKRGLLLPAVYLYICVIGFFMYDPSYDRADMRSSNVRLTVSARHVQPSQKTPPTNYAGPPRRPPTSYARSLRRPPTSKNTRRRRVSFLNLGITLRRYIERKRIETEIEAELKAMESMMQKPTP